MTHPYVTRGKHTGRVEYAPVFRPPFNSRRRAVRGGRWMVRKLRWNAQGKLWRAYTKGLNREYNDTFHTFEEAINYAQSQAGLKP